MPKKRSIHSYQEPIGAREAFTYARRSLEDTTKREEPIGSLREPSGATDRVIGSADIVIGSHREQQTELSGVQTELSGSQNPCMHALTLSGVIGLTKPMYACFNTIRSYRAIKTHIYAFTAIGASMPKEYTIGGQKPCIYVFNSTGSANGG